MPVLGRLAKEWCGIRGTAWRAERGLLSESTACDARPQPAVWDMRVTSWGVVIEAWVVTA